MTDKENRETDSTCVLSTSPCVSAPACDLWSRIEDLSPNEYKKLPFANCFYPRRLKFIFADLSESTSL